MDKSGERLRKRDELCFGGDKPGIGISKDGVDLNLERESFGILEEDIQSVINL